MSTTIDRKVIVTKKNGEILVLDNDDKVKTDTTTTFKCDGPRCASHSGEDGPKTISWNDEQVADDPSALPDDVARLIKTQFTPFSDHISEFCGVRCLKDYIDYSYVAPKSPRELAAQQLNNQKIEAAESPTALTQADGYAAQAGISI